jgi:2-oxoisovalerate ferredoxin oxidoreductase beta subunit
MTIQNKVLQKPKSFYDTFVRKGGAELKTTHYCPGCGHGILHKLIAEAISDFNIQDKTVVVSPVGCSVFAYYYFDTGNIQSAHGRAPAVGTGYKRANPDSILISYQGDGDLAAIGANEILQAANRGEAMTVFFINNAIYGMTGGQMAPTTLIGQKTTTTPYGRNSNSEGYPLRMSEIIATLEGPVYVERCMLTDAKNIAKTRKAVRKAIKSQIDHKGFSFVEILSGCPTGWKVSPAESKEWIDNVLSKYFVPGVFKDVIDERDPFIVKQEFPSHKDYHRLMEITHISDREDLVPTPSKTAFLEELKIAGFGGQGLLSLGYVIAAVAMGHHYEVSWLPSYGPEMRGGTANCSVKISDKRIGAPLVANPTILIVMNKPSMEKFENDVVSRGTIIYDNGLIDSPPSRNDVKVIGLPATEIADKLGNTKAANMILLGVFASLRKNTLSDAYIRWALPLILENKAFHDINQKAFDYGFNYLNK